MRFLVRFDGWVLCGSFNQVDLGRYRILYCITLLLGVPSLRPLASFPDSIYDAPLGPFRLWRGFLSLPVLTAIEIVIYLLIAALLVGICTKVVSLALSFMLIFAFGLTFGAGILEHLMNLAAVVPAVMAFANWGGTYSLDSLRRPSSRVEDPGLAGPASVMRGTILQPQWPMRIMALVIGVSFATAAVPKLLGGWLDLTTQASYGYQVGSTLVHDDVSWLAAALTSVHVPALWETLDWASVILESSVLLCVLSWRSWRTAIALLTLFHLSVALSLGIYFVGNIIAYGAFVSWSRVPFPNLRMLNTLQRRVCGGVITALTASAAVLWHMHERRFPEQELSAKLLLLCAALISGCYLVKEGILVLSQVRAWFRRPRRPIDQGASFRL